MTLPGGVYAQTYAQDQALIKTKPQWLWFIGFLIFIFTLPFFGGGRIMGMMNIIGITLIAVVGLQLNVGYTGQFNVGQSAFMGVGAFSAGALTLHYSLPIWITIPVAGIAAALFGAIFGLAAARIKGFYLALTTIAAHFVFSFAMMKLPKSWFGQSQGLRLPMISLFGVEFNTDIRSYYLVMILVVIMVYGAWGLIRSRTGRAFIAVRDNDNAAEIIGINVYFYKFLSFFIGAFYAGVAGALWAYYLRYVQADQFTLWNSAWYVGMLIVGGMGSILGAIIGTVLIKVLQEILAALGTGLVDIPFLAGMRPEIVFASMNVLLGIVIIFFVIGEPRGLVHRWNIIKESYRIWPFPH